MDDERSCFWTWDDIEYVWQCQKFKDRQLKRRKVKAKEKAREESKEKEEYSLVENKHRILNGSLEKMVLGGPKEEEARGVHRKVKIASLKMASHLPYQKRMQAKISTRTKAEERNKKERARKVLILTVVFPPRKHPMKKIITNPGIRRLV